MKNYFLFVLSLLLGMSANAQMANAPLKKDAYSDAAKRTTIFVLQSEDPKKSTKLKKTPEDYEAYCMFVEYHAKQRDWSSSSVELAFFGSPNEGQPGKRWRNLIKPKKKEKGDVLSDTED